MVKPSAKLNLAVYWAAACGGCCVSVLDVHEKLFDVIAAADLVFWPIALDFKYSDVEKMPDNHIDITLFNGAVRNSENEHLARLLRQKSKILIAYGSCSHLGGNLARVDLTAPYLYSARDLLTERMTRIMNSKQIRVYLESNVTELTGFVGNFKTTIKSLNGKPDAGNGLVEVEIGNVIVCTGYKEFDASRIVHYGYGKLPNVITSFELEKMLRAGRIETREGEIPRYIAIIHCVGSRSQEFHTYCSRVCCMTALKYAQEIKSAIPSCYISDIYIDMHAFGKGHEDFYRRSSEAKTLFLMYEKDDRPVIHKAGPKDNCGMLIEVNEKLSNECIEIPADLVVLMVGMEAREDAHEIARIVNISQDKDGWFIESHPKLEPVATTTDGVFIAGTCVAPKDIPDTVSQARVTAARILARIAKGRIEVDALYSEVIEEKCSGCRFCNQLCPFSAIEYDEENKRSHIISALCKGCGVCVAACPSSAINGRHFTDQQILAQVDGLFYEIEDVKLS